MGVKEGVRPGRIFEEGLEWWIKLLLYILETGHHLQSVFIVSPKKNRSWWEKGKSSISCGFARSLQTFNFTSTRQTVWKVVDLKIQLIFFCLLLIYILTDQNEKKWTEVDHITLSQHNSCLFTLLILEIFIWCFTLVKTEKIGTEIS